MVFKTYLLDLGYACGAIGVEHESEELGHKVVELRTGQRIGKLSALSTRFDMFVNTTGAYLAPSGL